MPPVVAEDGDPHPAWSVPAGEDDYNDAAIFLLSAVEPEAEAPRAQFVAQILKTREYSRAELALVMRELPFDPDASHNYGGGLNPADVQRIVDRHRELRARLTQKITSEQRDDLIAEFPEELDPDGFRIAGWTQSDDPLWRYAPGVQAGSSPAPSPEEAREENGQLPPPDATGAASQGNPNECASKAADAKERVLELHENAATLEEIDVE